MYEIDKHGDLIERSYSSFIRSRLDGYEKIWSCYIGNDGHARMPSIPHLDPKSQNKRQAFSQMHYTILESLLCMRIIAESSDYEHIIDESGNFDLNLYISVINNYIAFHSHAGRIRDLIIKIGDLYRLPDLADHLNDLYRKRCTVLHNSKAPIEFVAGAIAILLPGGITENETEWHKDKLWSDASNTSLEFINVYLETAFNGIVTTVNNCLNRLYSTVITKIIRSKCIDLEPVVDGYSTDTLSTSGVSSSSVG
ncbi:MAG: hypothetical protein H8D55_01730 [Deltaproteobacteria bacterium]|nr:hypothetical protein [Deltaproteobacteria bacterium]